MTPEACDEDRPTVYRALFRNDGEVLTFAHA